MPGANPVLSDAPIHAIQVEVAGKKYRIHFDPEMGNAVASEDIFIGDKIVLRKGEAVYAKQPISNLHDIKSEMVLYNPTGESIGHINGEPAHEVPDFDPV